MTKQEIIQLLEDEIAQAHEAVLRFPSSTSRKMIADAVQEVMARHANGALGVVPYSFHEWKIEYGR